MEKSTVFLDGKTEFYKGLKTFIKSNSKIQGFSLKFIKKILEYIEKSVGENSKEKYAKRKVMMLQRKSMV